MGGRRTVSPVASILTTSIPFSEPGGTRMPGCWFGLTVTLALWEAARSGAIARRFIVGGWERERGDDYFSIFLNLFSSSDFY